MSITVEPTMPIVHQMEFYWGIRKLQQRKGPVKVLNAQLKLIMETGADKRRENFPASNEVAIIIPDEYDVAGSRDIILDHYGNGFSTINPNHAAYTTLHYVLLFPHGEHGWHWALQLQNVEQNQRSRLSQRAYYRFRLHIRSKEAKTLFSAQRLFQQYIVDAWAVCEVDR